jgi:hypothetical protein
MTVRPRFAARASDIVRISSCATIQPRMSRGFQTSVQQAIAFMRFGPGAVPRAVCPVVQALLPNFSFRDFPDPRAKRIRNE